MAVMLSNYLERGCRWFPLSIRAAPRRGGRRRRRAPMGAAVASTSSRQ